MEIDVIGLSAACSYALDCIEKELVHVSNKHGKKVAYLSVKIAKALNINGIQLQDLTMLALLHDNALTQYLYEEFKCDLTKARKATYMQLGIHCIYGEKNISKLPFKNDVEGVILFHHENANGSGPFKKNVEETPLFARIIHLCDVLDTMNLDRYDNDLDKYEALLKYVNDNNDILFDHTIVDAFNTIFTYELYQQLNEKNVEKLLWQQVPREKYECDQKAIEGIAEFFGNIIDYKSTFTASHSLSVALYARRMSALMGYDEYQQLRVYLAGVFHDLGKMAVGNDILEKPDQLTNEEFEKMKNHAYYTYMLLDEVEDFNDIRDMAAFHHEKLDGSGYPFNKTGDELTDLQKMMAVVDIYQALSEERPYKKGMDKQKIIMIMNAMVDKNQLDASLTRLMLENF